MIDLLPNMHFRIHNVIATSCLVTALERTKFVFSWGSAPDHAGGAYTPSWFKRALLLRGGEENGRKGVGEWREREGQGEGKYKHPLHQFLRTPLR